MLAELGPPFSACPRFSSPASAPSHAGTASAVCTRLTCRWCLPQCLVTVHTHGYTQMHTYTHRQCLYKGFACWYPQVTEERALYHTECILTKSMHQDHPAPIPWGLSQQLCSQPSIHALRDQATWFRITCPMVHRWLERQYSLGVKMVSSGLRSWQPALTIHVSSHKALKPVCVLHVKWG